MFQVNYWIISQSRDIILSILELDSQRLTDYILFLVEFVLGLIKSQFRFTCLSFFYVLALERISQIQFH